LKKLIFSASILAMLVACGGGGEEKKVTTETSEVKADDLSSNPDYQKGVELTSKSDCFTCHKIDEKNIGPAWREVAAKYAGQDTAINYLAHKIKNGGSGVWGQVPMAPHPAMTDEDAQAIAKYVLLLKK
jgi:cytochrome c